MPRGTNLTMKPSADVGGLPESLRKRAGARVATVVCRRGDESNHTGYAMENGRYRCDGEPNRL